MAEYTAVITIGIKAEKDTHGEHIVDKILDASRSIVNVTDFHAALYEEVDNMNVPVCEWKPVKGGEDEQ